MSKKDKKRKVEAASTSSEGATKKSLSAAKGRNYTISIAIGGSIGDGLSTVALAHLAAQMVRAATSCAVDEICIYVDDRSKASKATAEKLAEALQWIETPPALRTNLHCEPSDAALLSALKSLPPLKAPHHLSQNEAQWAPYREGVVLRTSGEEEGFRSFVDVGLDRMAVTSMLLPVGARVTLAMGLAPETEFFKTHSESFYLAAVVAAIEPRTKLGLYWGFVVRLAPSLSDALKKGPYKSGYDLTVGLSREGVERHQTHDLVLPRFSHLLMVLGGQKGLKEISDADPDLKEKSAEDHCSLLLNICPDQPTGSSLNAEEALLMGLGYLRPAILEYGGVNKA